MLISNKPKIVSENVRSGCHLKMSTPFIGLHEMEDDLDGYKNRRELYIPVTVRHMYGRKILEYKPTSDEIEQWIRICRKFWWFNNCPVNHDDGLWETF
jgi:hypothetical protein